MEQFHIAEKDFNIKISVVFLETIREFLQKRIHLPRDLPEIVPDIVFEQFIFQLPVTILTVFARGNDGPAVGSTGFCVFRRGGSRCHAFLQYITGKRECGIVRELRENALEVSHDLSGKTARYLAGIRHPDLEDPAYLGAGIITLIDIRLPGKAVEKLNELLVPVFRVFFHELDHAGNVIPDLRGRRSRASARGFIFLRRIVADRAQMSLSQVHSAFRADSAAVAVCHDARPF